MKSQPQLQLSSLADQSCFDASTLGEFDTLNLDFPTHSSPRIHDTILLVRVMLRVGMTYYPIPRPGVNPRS
jgi:hypothetical protein